MLIGNKFCRPSGAYSARSRRMPSKGRDPQRFLRRSFLSERPPQLSAWLYPDRRKNRANPAPEILCSDVCKHRRDWVVSW